MKRVLVVGAGAAGLMAGGQAAACGARVIIFDRMPQAGAKLALTGNGRGNVTNTRPVEDFLAAFNPAGRDFLRQAFHAFSPEDLIAFLDSIGVPCRPEPDGRVFPTCQSARAVADALVRFALGHGARVETSTRVERLAIADKTVRGVFIRAASGAPREIPGDAVLVATGGLSYPQTGSSGDGFRLAEEAGHRIVPLRPALVPLETAGPLAGRLPGVALRAPLLIVRVNGKKAGETRGDTLFTHFGLSGPGVLRLSGAVVDALRQDGSVELVLDLAPDETAEELDRRLVGSFAAHGRQTLRRLLDPLLPHALIPAVGERAQVDLSRTGSQIKTDERRRLCGAMKALAIPVTGARPIEEAMVTAGGVDTREVDPRTMRSRLVKGLFFAGEVLDVNGDTGGFNLQAAFSTGWLAGRSAAAGADSPPTRPAHGA